MNKHELHPDLQDASLEKACKMAACLAQDRSAKSVDLHYMLEYLRLNFDLVPKDTKQNEKL